MSGARALCAFSGGLDGMLAAGLVAGQGVQVLLVTFTSPFFGSAAGRRGAAALGLPWTEEDLTTEVMALLADPPSGFGSLLNPCIDCHAAMLARLRRRLEADGFDFVFSGEVLGQRPMSQSRGSLARVARLSGLGDRLVRPLSALLLPPTRPELTGLLDRSGLLDISGRGRKRQIELARALGLEYPAPAGGCLLTDPGYCGRLSAVMEAGLLSPDTARMAAWGRVFRLGEGSVLVLGRDEEDCGKLEEISGGAVFSTTDRPGPSAVMLGPGDELLAASLVALYAKVPRGTVARVSTPSGRVAEVLPASPEDAARMIVRTP
jgi:hypothetical protein